MGGNDKYTQKSENLKGWLLGICWHRWEESIKRDIRETGCKDVQFNF
jgi:hypothetical protein